MRILGVCFFGGVFPVIVFDNLKTAVRTVLRGKNRIEQDQFVKFRSYYTFEARFCNPASGREKGGVEGLVGFARRNFLVPLPEVADYEELNRLLAERCLAHGNGIIAGREDRRSIDERHEEECSRLLPLPPKPFENIKPVQCRSAGTNAMVDRNRYSCRAPMLAAMYGLILIVTESRFTPTAKRLAIIRDCSAIANGKSILSIISI